MYLCYCTHPMPVRFVFLTMRNCWTTAFSLGKLFTFPTLCFSLSPLSILSSLLSLYFFSFLSSLSLPKNGTQLNVAQPVQLDPASQWMHRRTSDSFLSRMEQRKKTWAVRVLEGEEGEPPAAKQQRIAQSEGQNKKKPPEIKIIRNSFLCLLFSI